MEIYYHGSDQRDLAIIKPNISTHGKKYIYATKYRNIALLFLCRWNDFLLSLETTIIDNKLEITLVERYKGAMNDIYLGKSGVIYAFESDNFIKLPEMWEFEFVSEQEEEVKTFEIINDILCEIQLLNKTGEIEIYHYPNRPKNIPKDDHDMVKKSMELYKLSGGKYNALYCIKKFPHLKDEIIKKFIEEYNIDLNNL